MSPEFSKIFIFELSDLLNIPGNIPILDTTKISHLLWADDLILIALDENSLQTMLDQLNNFCTQWGLSVNFDKTKIMIFNKSGRTIKPTKPLMLGSVVLDHSKTYCYLGIYFNLCGSFVTSLDELRKKALREYFLLKRSINIKHLSFKAVCILYDALIRPIITYACEVWLPHSKLFQVLLSDMDHKQALKNIALDPFERVHLQFMKWSLNTHKKSSNSGCWGDSGRYPIGIAVLKQVLDYETTLESHVDRDTFIAASVREQKT